MRKSLRRNLVEASIMSSSGPKPLILHNIGGTYGSGEGKIIINQGTYTNCPTIDIEYAIIKNYVPGRTYWPSYTRSIGTTLNLVVPKNDAIFLRSQTMTAWNQKGYSAGGSNSNWIKAATTTNYQTAYNMYGNLKAFINDGPIVPYCLAGLFYQSWDAALYNQGLELPDTELAEHCYEFMFYCCCLGNPIELPATTLAPYCYRMMFYNSGLTSAPVLPATELADGCYYMMFRDSRKLTSAPVLPATTLVPSCYEYMFYECTSLVNPPALPATTLAGSCYKEMFSGCTSLKSTPELLATTLKSNCYWGMFSGCTNLETCMSELPSTGNEYGQYYKMFSNCKKLTVPPDIRCVGAQNTHGVTGMFNGCTSLEREADWSGVTGVANSSDNVYAGCTSITTATALQNIVTDVYYGLTSFYAGCTSLVSAKLPKKFWELKQTFSGCTSLTTIDPITDLNAVSSGKVNLTETFKNCSSLSRIECLVSDPTRLTLTNWVSGIAPAGTFVIKTGTRDVWENTIGYGPSGIPEGWTVEEDPFEPPDDEVWYSTESGNVLNISQYDTVFSQAIGGIYNGPEILSNTYVDGKGVIKFADSLTKVGVWMNGSTVNYCLPLIINTSFGLSHDLTSILLPNSITSIETLYVDSDYYISEFFGCNKLKNIKLPRYITNIPEGMCESCTALTSITIPNNVTLIDWAAFYSCTNLTSCTIGSSCVSVGQSSFDGCNKLVTVNCLPATPPVLKDKAFAANASGRKFYVPSQSVDIYKSNSYWKEHAGSIEAIQ